MQLSKIRVGAWYQTTLKGIGQCIAVNKKSVHLIGPLGAAWFTAKEIRYEIPKGDEPTIKRSANEGTLRKQTNNRWAIILNDGDRELTSGQVLEVNVGGQWIETSIEHSGKDYYATTAGVRLCEGLSARVK